MTASPATLTEFGHMLDALRADVQQLKAALGRQRKVTIKAVRSQLFLGESASLVITATHSDGRPAIGEPITLVTNWGTLWTADANGKSVTVSTNSLGVVRVALTPTTAAPLTQHQQNALQVALQALDENASTPEQARPGLTALARAYNLPANQSLRHAVDVYFQEYISKEDRPNPVDDLLRWNYHEATVIAYVHNAAQTEVVGTGVCELRYKDWLRAWISVMSADDTQNEASRNINVARLRNESGTDMQSDMFGRLNTLLERQRGLAGRFAAQHAVGKALQTFIDHDFSDLSLDVKTKLLPTLGIINDTLAGRVTNSALARENVKLQVDLEHGVVSDSRLGSIVDSHIAGRGFLTEAALNERRFVTEAGLGALVGEQLNDAGFIREADFAGLLDRGLEGRNFATNDQLAGFIRQADFAGLLDRGLEGRNFATNDQLAGFIRQTDFAGLLDRGLEGRDFVTSGFLAEAGFIRQADFAGLLDRGLEGRDFVTSGFLAEAGFIRQADFAGLLDRGLEGRNFATNDQLAGFIREADFAGLLDRGLEGRDFVTSGFLAEAGFVQRGDFDTLVDSALAGQDFVRNHQLTGFVTEARVGALITGQLSNANFMTQGQVTELVGAQIASRNLVTASQVTAIVNDRLRTDGFVTNSQLLEAGFVRQVDFAGLMDRQLTERNVITAPQMSSFIDRRLSESGFITPQALSTQGFVTAAQLDSRGYVTQVQLNNRGFITQPQVTTLLQNGGYVTQTQMNTILQTGGYVTQPQVTTLLQNGGYVTRTDNIWNTFVTNNTFTQRLANLDTAIRIGNTIDNRILERIGP